MEESLSQTVSWGVLSTAKIAREKVIPAMQRGTLSRIDAIASRDAAKAADTAASLGIPKSYGSYEELLADPEVTAALSPAEIEEKFDLGYHTKHVDTIFRRVFGEA